MNSLALYKTITLAIYRLNRTNHIVTIQPKSALEIKENNLGVLNPKNYELFTKEIIGKS